MRSSVLGLAGVVVVAALAFAGDGPSQPGPGVKDKQEKAKPDPRVPIAVYERDAKPQQVVRTNGVTFTVRTNAPRMLGDKVIELFWTLRYDGPRSPLVIVKPSLEIPSGVQTFVLLHAAPAGKDYGYSYATFSPLFEQEKPLAAGIGCCLPFPPLLKFKKSKDDFLFIPSGKQVRGCIQVSLREMKALFLRAYPGEFDRKRAPTLFADVHYRPYDRAEDLSLDAWTGDLTTGPLVVRGLKEW
jgi:hypothetical protein